MYYWRIKTLFPFIISAIILININDGFCQTKDDHSSDISDSTIFNDISSAIKINSINSEQTPIKIIHDKNKDYDPLQSSGGNKNLINQNLESATSYNDMFGSSDYNQDINQQNKNIHQSKHIDIKIEDRNEEYQADIVHSMMEQALTAFKLGHLEASTTLYQNIVAIDEDNQDALLGLAITFHQQGLLEEAKKIYTKILSHNPLNQIALNNFLSLVGQDSPEIALFELKKLESINPKMSIIPAQISILYSNQKEYKMALQYLKKAYLLAPDTIHYKYNLAILLDKLGDRENSSKLYRDLIIDSENNISLPGSVEVIKKRFLYLNSKNY